MKSILVLGAGLVSSPLVRYLLERGTYDVVVASRTVAKAERLIDGHARGRALKLNVKEDTRLDELVMHSDLVISLLPYVYHVKVAKLCLKHGKNMVTTSYVSEAMRQLHDRAVDEGIIILNECGLDPGIDHMSAMRIIHDVQERGGEITSFSSCCGALPAHVSNNNPFGYKFSWAPRGVVLAGKNPAKYRKDGKEIVIPGPELFENYEFKTIPGVGVFENYPNRDSIPYAELYGIERALTVYRGTLRYPGWCETLRKIAELGFLDETKRADIGGMTYGQLIRRLIGDEEDMAEALAKHLNVEPHSTLIKRLCWLGLASDDAIPESDDTYLDVLATAMQRKMAMDEGDVDICVLFHEFRAAFPGGKLEYITSTLVDHGVPGADTAISRTVALPAAIAADMILGERISARGVHIPIVPDIYEPILDKLQTLDIRFHERTEILRP